jgi:iron(III) transport system ATP-binding protein
VALVEMAVQGLDAPLFARVWEADAPSLSGEIGISIDAGAVLVFFADHSPNGGPA